VATRSCSSRCAPPERRPWRIGHRDPQSLKQPALDGHDDAATLDGVILTELPDLPPRPATARSAQFRRDFYRRWGRENCIVSGDAKRADYGLFRQTLSIKCVARGHENYFVDRRRITVSDDTFLVLNEGRVYASSLDNPTQAYSFSIFFRPGIGQEVTGALQGTLETALDDGPQSRPVSIEFDESLQHHDSKISPVLRFIQRNVAAGVRDEGWLEEQCQFLVERMVQRLRPRMKTACAERGEIARPQRVEIARRLEWVTDFMHSNLASNITLEDMAAAARLSRFHFLRLFTSAHGRTPTAFLRELRMRRALALLGSTTLGVSEIAARVGMSRITLWRSFQSEKGAGARDLRRLEEASSAAFLSR
jgi:AraC-like DNA-binding protein